MMDQGAYYDGNAYPVQPEYGDVGQPQKRRFYWCSLVVVNVCSLISYSIMASAKHYGEFTALEFTVGAGVLSWLSSGFLLVYQCFAHKTNSDISTDPHRFLLAVHLFFAIFAYSAAISSASISADLETFDDDAFELDDKEAKTENAFIHRVRASCAFAWLAAVAYIAATAQVIQTSCNYDHMKAMKLLHAHDSSEETLPGFINGFVANPEGPSDQAFQPQPPIPPPSSSVPAEPPSMGSDV
jgi:hypothetical protein